MNKIQLIILSVILTLLAEILLGIIHVPYNAESIRKIDYLRRISTLYDAGIFLTMPSKETEKSPVRHPDPITNQSLEWRSWIEYGPVGKKISWTVRGNEKITIRDECQRGTWRQEGKIVFVCPNPSNGAWGSAATQEEIMTPQKWQKFDGKKDFFNPGKSRYYRTEKIFAVCGDEGVPHQKKGGKSVMTYDGHITVC